MQSRSEYAFRWLKLYHCFVSVDRKAGSDIPTHAEARQATHLGMFVLQGNCSEPPTARFAAAIATGPPMLPLLPRQCVLVNDAPMLYVRHGSMLLDNVYMRRQAAASSSSALVYEREGRWFPWQQSVKLWMTNVTMQARIFVCACNFCAGTERV